VTCQSIWLFDRTRPQTLTFWTQNLISMSSFPHAMKM